MKLLKIIAVFFLVIGFIACAGDKTSVKKTAPDYTEDGTKVKKRTPRFASLEDAIEYLGVAISESLNDPRKARKFKSQSSSVSKKPPMTAEERTRKNAQDAMDELDREIDKSEGKSSDQVTVKSSEDYSTQDSSNMGGARSSSGKPMVIAITDFITVEEKITKLGRYLSDKLTPYFSRSRQFSVLERALIEKVIDEQRFQVSSFVDEKSTMEFGKLVGAQAIISGTISELNDAFYINAKVIGVTRGDLMVSVDVEVNRSSRLTALYNTDIPHLNKRRVKTKIFRAEGMGIPNPNDPNPTRAKILALRAAKGDAMRNLIQQIQGVNVSSDTTIKDMMTQDDNIRIQINSTLQGARMVNKRYNPDGSVEVEMEVELTEEFLEILYSQ